MATTLAAARRIELVATVLLVVAGWGLALLAFYAWGVVAGAPRENAAEFIPLLVSSVFACVFTGRAVLRRWWSAWPQEELPTSIPARVKPVLYLVYWIVVAPILLIVTLGGLLSLPALFTRSFWGESPPLAVQILLSGFSVVAVLTAIAAVIWAWQRIRSGPPFGWR